MVIGVDIRALGSGRRSGVEEYILSLLPQLVAAAPDVTFKLLWTGRKPAPLDALPHAPNAQVIHRHISNRVLFGAALLGALPLDELVGGADVFFFPHILAGALSQKCRRVTTVHDLSFVVAPHFFSLKQKAWHLVMRPRRFVRASYAVIAVSRATKLDVVREYGIPDERVHVVHSGVPHIVTPANALPASDPYFIALGTFEPRKNSAGVLDAFAQCASRVPRVRLCLVGYSGSGEGKIVRAIAHHPFRDRIDVHLNASDAERDTLLAGARALVYPSFLEGFGFPPLAACALGVPVVASDVGALPEVLHDAALLVSPYDTSELASAMHALATDDALHGLTAMRAKARATHFSWERSARETLALLRG
ncbi:MAG: glycosyltransferase family 1 protein [Patescibacteria group bacterium]